MMLLEQFICYMYCITMAEDKDNRRRKALLANGKSIVIIPLTKNDLLEHIKRATYQAGYALPYLNLIYVQELFITSSFRFLILCYLNGELTTILLVNLLCFKIN